MIKIGKWYIHWIGICAYDGSIDWRNLFYFQVVRYNNGVVYTAHRFGPIHVKRYL